MFAALFGWLTWLAAPSGLPIGGGDLTHHLQLVDYLERHWRLVHDPQLVEPYLGEMVHYTPGVHVLSALVGAWTGGDGLHAVHAVVAFSIALKAAFVVLITLRALAAHHLRLPLAAASAGMLLLPYPYVLDSLLRDSFLAQVMSECFAVAMWWALVIWDEAPTPWSMALFALFAAGAFLTWPIWIGPPCVALGLALVFRRQPAFRTRFRHGALAFGPLAVIVAIYLAGRISQLGMSAAAGAVLRPSIGAASALLLGLGGAGLVAGLAALRRPADGAPRTRAALFLLAGIALQSGVLYLQARAAGNDTAYMAFKTLYLAPYPLAVLSIVPVAWLGNRWRHARHATSRGPWSAVAPAIAWLFVVLIGVHAAIRLRAVRRPAPALTEAVLRAGTWAHDHLPRGCIAYMVPDDDTSYWLHLAVLRNPRMGARSADLATYSMDRTIIRWLSTEAGLPYAIADLPALSRDVRDDLDVIARFDTAAIIRRRGPAACEDEQLPPAP